MNKPPEVTIDKVKTIDSLENLVAQVGTEGDKREHGRFVNNRMLSMRGNEQQLSDMYRSEWIAGKVVDLKPNDMTREWRRFTGDVDPGVIQQFIEAEEYYKLRQHFNLAHKWARLYGNGFIVMDIDDGQTPEMPLDINRIRPGGLRHIKSIDRHRIQAHGAQVVTDPLNPNYGLPERYRFNETNVIIHASRLLRFEGIPLPFDEFRRNNYFSASVLERIYDSMMNFTITTQGAATMVYEANVDIVKVKGLMGYLQSEESENLLRKRFALAKLLKSFNNTLLLDQDETFESKTTAFAGLTDLMMAQALFVAGASDTPATRMLGSAASGLNATGEGDLKNYYDSVRSEQGTEYKPNLDYFDRILAKSLGLPDDTNLNYQFVSLFQMTPKEQAEVNKLVAETDTIYLQDQVIPVSTVAKELKQNETYTNIDDDYITLLESFENGDNNLDDDEGDPDFGASANPE